MLTRRVAARLARWLLIGGGVVVVAIVVALAALHAPPGRRFVLARVTEMLAAQNIGVAADTLRFNLLDLSISLEQVTVRAPQKPEPPFAVVARLEADLSLVDLVRGRYVVESARVEGLRLRYVVDADGSDNMPRPPVDPDAPAGDPLDVLVVSASVDADVQYENRAQQIDVAIPASAVAVAGDRATGRHAVELETGAGTLRVDDRRVQLGSLRAALDVGTDDLRIDRAAIDVEGSRAEVSGTLAGFDDPQADLRLAATLDVARAAAIGGLADPAGGRLVVDARARGPVSALAVEARLEGRDLSFQQVRDVAVDLHAGYAVADGTATVHALDTRAPWGRLTARGAVATTGQGASHVEVEAAGVQVDELMRALSQPQVLATQLDARLAARWPGLDYAAATGDGRLTLRPKALRQSALPLGGQIALAARDGRITATLNALRAAGARLDGRVTLTDRETIGGALQVGIADVGDTAARLEILLGQSAGSLAPSGTSGRIQASATLRGTVSDPVVATTIDAPALTVAGTGNLALSARLTVTPAVATIGALNVTWDDATAEAAGRVGLAADAPIALDFRLQRLTLPALLAVAGRDRTLAAGTLSMTGRAEGTLGRPAVSATLHGSDLALLREPLGTLRATLHLTGREAALTNFVLDKPQPEGNGRLTASGRYHLDTGAYAFEVDSERLALIGLTLPDGRPVTGRVAVRGDGTGTAAMPAATVTLVADDIRLASHDLGRVAVDAAVAGDTATIDIAADRFGLTADATIGVASPHRATLDARIAALDLTRLPIAIATPFSGTLTATLNGSGDLSAPERADARVTIDGFEGTWNAHPVAIDGPAVLGLSGEQVTIERLSVRAQDSTVSVTGTLPMAARAGEGVLHLDARANLSTLVDYVPEAADVSAGGALTLVGTLRGNLERIDPDLRLTLDDGSVTSAALAPGLTAATVRARVASGAATLEQFAAAWGPARLDATARVPLELLEALPIALPAGGGQATARARLVDLDPGTLPGAPAGTTGRIGLDVEATADRAAVGAIDGRLTFSDLRVAFKELDLAQRQPSTLRVDNGLVSIERVDLAGTAGTVRARGSVGLLDARPLDVAVDGVLETAALSAFTDAVRAEGQASLTLTASGTLDNPDLAGLLTLSDATLAVDEPAVLAERLSARVELAGARVTIASLTGEVNGGTIDGRGSLAIADGGLRDVDIQLTATDVAFAAPLDLRSLTDATLTVRERDGEVLVGGTVTIQEAGLTTDLDFDTGLLAALTAPGSLDLTEDRDPLLERVRFNVQVETATPIVVDNNLGRAEVTTDLRVLGTPYELGLSGQLQVLEGSEITLNERRYAVERGTITFLDERRILPSMDLRLLTTAGRYDVTLGITGEPGDTDTTITSDPALPEPDIMALLITGRTLDEMRGEEYDVARQQVLSYLAGRVGSRLGRGLERATGLSEVRLEPNLIANEADPSARLTVGQDLTDSLALVYSTDLTDSSDQIWVARYDVTRRFQSNVTRQSDGAYRFDFRHDVRAGGRPAPARLARTRPTILSIDVETDAGLTDDDARRLLGLKVGAPYDFFAAIDGVREIEAALHERGHLQARVRLERSVDSAGAALRLRLRSGPRVSVRYDGMSPPRAVDREVRRQWSRGVFDAQRGGDAVEALRAWLIADRYLSPTVAFRLEDSGTIERQVVLTVAPGPRYDRIELQFDGAAGVDPSTLDDIIDEQDLERQLFTDPLVVTTLLRRYYREEGYLTAEIEAPRYEYEGPVARVVLVVREGPRFAIGEVTVAGNRVFETPVLLADLPVVAGDPFLPRVAQRALDRIRDLYWRKAYNDVRSGYTLAPDPRTGRVDIRFEVREGVRSVVAGVTVEGPERTSDRLVREQVELTPGEPLDLAALSRSRRNLYDTSAFSIVDITRETTPDAAPDQGSDGDKPVHVTVAVREVQPFQIRYGGSFDTERGPGGIVDLSNHNSLGHARVLGLNARYDSRLREGRLYLSQPSLRSWPVQTTASVYYREERNRETALSDPFNIDRFGASIQQERALGGSYVWTYGYRYERARRFAAARSLLDQPTVTVSPMTSTFLREGRDDILDASTGSFTSHALSYSPSWLGADASFVKYYGQYFRYIPLQAPQRKRFTNEILRPRFVYALGARLGIARGIGGAVPETERFYAGGSTTLRGFEQNAVGPVDLDRIPSGGDVLLVVNNEIRAPLFGPVDGVGFVDIGNVFARAGDLSLADLRETAGVGLRLRTPWFLLRGDYGLVLDLRPGERRSRVFFSIGQAF